LAAKAALSAEDGQLFGVQVARLNQPFPADVTREMLALLQKPARTVGHPLRQLAIFLVTVVPTTLSDNELVSRWCAALPAYFAMGTTYSWGSKQKREKLQSVASEPHFVRGVQAIAVGCQDVRLDILAVLCRHGSNDSIDALMPHFARAERNGERLKQLLTLDKHVNPQAPSVRSLLKTAKERLAALSQQSPARDLAEFLGFKRPDVFWFDASCWSAEPDGRISRYQGSVKVDSRSPCWFAVRMALVFNADGRHSSSTTRFDNEKLHEDDLELGACAAEQLPSWLAQAARTLAVIWSPPHISASVRGKKRKVIEDWLCKRRDSSDL
jgi:hypothetical protein